MFQKMNNGSAFNEPDPSTGKIYLNKDEANARMARELLGDRISPTTGPNQDALPNPWAPARNSPTNSASSPLGNMMNFRSQAPFNPHNQPVLPNQMLNPFVMPQGAGNPMQNFMQQYSMMQQAIQPLQYPVPPSEPVEVRYRTELDTLKDMGFTVITTYNLRTKSKTKERFLHQGETLMVQLTILFLINKNYFKRLKISRLKGRINVDLLRYLWKRLFIDPWLPTGYFSRFHDAIIERKANNTDKPKTCLNLNEQ
jgi:hypothetical protein